MTKCTTNSDNTVTENERFTRFRLNDFFRDAVALILRKMLPWRNLTFGYMDEKATILHPSNPDLLMQSHRCQFSLVSQRSKFPHCFLVMLNCAKFHWASLNGSGDHWGGGGGG